MPPRDVTAETLPPTGRGDRLVVVARKLGDGAEGAEAPLRIGIGDFRGAGRWRSAEDASFTYIFPAIGPGEYRLVGSGQAGPAGAEPAVTVRTSRRPSPSRSGRAADRREAAGGERARDRVVVVQCVEQVVHAERPEEVVVLRRSASGRR